MNEAGELMEAFVSSAQKYMNASKEEVAAATAQANRISLTLAIVVVIALLASVAFSFLGVARPYDALEWRAREMAAAISMS